MSLAHSDLAFVSAGPERRWGASVIEGRALLRLAAPIMLIGLVNMAMSLTDAAMVARYFGTAAFAAVAVGSDLYSIVFYLVVAAFVQGAAVGAMMRGIPVENGQFAGDSLGWLHPFPMLTGAGLVLGYALLGAGWLAFKTEGGLRDWAHARIPWLVAGVVVLLGLAFVTSLTIDAGAIAQSNLGLRRWGLVFPIVGLVALVGVLAGTWARFDSVPYVLTVLFFLSAFATLGAMMWPYMIPYALTVADAAAPDASLRFFFYGGILVLPVIAAYTVGVYWLFRGKIEGE